MTEFVEIVGTGLRYAGYTLFPLLFAPILVLAFPRPLSGVSLGLSGLLDRISGAAMSIAAFAAFLIIVAQLVAVLLRYVFGLSFSWMTDTVIFSFAAIFMLGAAATLRDDAHVRVDILRSRFSEKTKAVIELIGAMVFIFPIAILILYAGSGIISRAWIGLEPFIESDGLPVKYLFKTLVPAFAILMIFQGLSQALKSALIVRGMPPPASATTGTEGAL